MASLGTLVLELAANTARMQSDLGKAVGIAERAAGQIKNAFKFAGGGLLGASILGLAKQSIEFGDSINKASIKAGIGVKAMSELAYAAKLADVDIASLSVAVKKMQVSLSEASTGAKEPKLALDALGLTLANLQKLKPEDQFELIADRISKLKDPVDRARAATVLFGKAGADLLPLFEQGAAGIAKARAEADKLGLSFGEEQIKKLADADDSIKKLDASWRGFATTLTAWVAPALSKALDMLSGADTRSPAQVIGDQISRLQKEALSPDATFAEADAIQQKIEQLQKLQDMSANLHPELGGRGRTVAPGGFASADATAAAAEAAKKARDADLKSQESFIKEAEEMRSQMDERASQDSNDQVAEDIARQIDYYDKLEELRKEDAEKLKAWREQQATQLSENAQIVKDAFMTSWDAWFRNGKFRIDELFKYILVEFARRGIAQLFDKIFLPKAGGGAGGGGFLDKVFGAIGGLFGGGRANGGGVEAGKIYRINENTPNSELWSPGANGTVFPAGSLGGGTTINANMYLHAPGATMELVRVLPRMFEAHKDRVIAEVDERLKRRKIGVR